MTINALRRLRRVLFGILPLFVLAAKVSASAPAAPQPPVKLVVVVVVDGLSWPRLDGYRGWLDGCSLACSPSKLAGRKA